MGSLNMMTVVPCTAAVELTPDARQNINFFNKGNPDHRGVDDYKMINIGKEFNNFFQPCNQLKEEGHIVQMKLPRSFSETRLPNYAVLCMKGSGRTFLHFSEGWKVFRLKIDKERQNADKAAGLQIQIYRFGFCFECDGHLQVVPLDCECCADGGGGGCHEEIWLYSKNSKDLDGHFVRRSEDI